MMTDKVYTPGHGPMGAKLMIVSDCPTLKDQRAGKALTENREIQSVMIDAGLNINNCWKTTVSKYHVPPNPPHSAKKIPFHTRAKTAGIDLQEQVNELREEVSGVRPNLILALGKTALWALTGKTNIENMRGSMGHSMGSKYIISYNPQQLGYQASDIEFKGYWNRSVMVCDFKRAKAEMDSPDLVLPNRNIEICQNSAHLASFFYRYKDYLRMAADIEANGTCFPVCIGLAFTPNHAMVVPLWNCEGISTIPDSDMVQIWILLAEALYGKQIVGQNFNYDRDKILRLGFAISRISSDVMLKSHAINPELPKRLAFNTSIFTREPFYKDEGMYEGTLMDLFKGCGRDACVTIEIDQNMDTDLDDLGMRPFYEKFLLQLPDLYWRIERQGFRVNTDVRDSLIRKYIEWDERLRYELFKLVGVPINVNSNPQVSNLLYENLKLPRREGTGEEEITALLNSQSAVKNPAHRRICELILEDRRVRKSISTYLMALPDYDGRMRTTYYPCLDTGRTSTGQQDPPIRPSIEVIDENGAKKKKSLGTAFQTMTKHGDIGNDIRSMYVPDTPEEIFVQADSSQAEARVVALLSDDDETLELYDKHDIHALTASWFFGGVEDDYSKKKLGYEHPIRFVGKTLRHAGHLGAQKRRAATTVNTDARKYKIPIVITEAIADQALKIFHAKTPKVQRVFQAGVIRNLEQNRQLLCPRPWGYSDVPLWGRRTFFERWGEELFRQAFSYIPQRTVSDNTKAAALRIIARIPTIKIVMESHDALLFCIPIVKLQEWVPIIKQEMERPIDFSVCSIPRHELVIPCEIETGYDYQNLTKFKDFTPVVIPTIPKYIPKDITDAFTAR